MAATAAGSPFSSLDEAILTGPNPFEPDRVSTPWDPLPADDIPSIHEEQTRRLLELLEAVRVDGHSRCVTVMGQPGFGKTHLLTRLRNRLQPPSLFVYVTAFPDPQRPSRHLLRSMVEALQRQASDPFGSHSPGSHPQKRPLVELVARASEQELAARLGSVDRDVLAALRQLGGRRGELARAWLSGLDLDPGQMRRLRVVRSLAEEEEAYRACVSLGRVAALWGPVVMAFDQLEFLPDSPAAPGLSIFGRWLARLCDEIPNTLMVMACLSSTLARGRELWGQSVVDRIASQQVSLQGLRAEQAQQLCHSRMRRLYGPHSPPWMAYPFLPEFFQRLAGLGGWGARMVLRHCSAALEEMRRQGRVQPLAMPSARVQAAWQSLAGEEAREPASGPAAPAASPESSPSREAAREANQVQGQVKEQVREQVQRELDLRLQRRPALPRRFARAPAQPALDAAELARSLYWLVVGLAARRQAAGGGPAYRVEYVGTPAHARVPLVRMEVGPPGLAETAWLAASCAPSGQGFFHETERLLREQEQAGPGLWILVRPSELKVLGSWHRGRENLARWQARGGLYVELDHRALDFLRALTEVVAQAATGDLATPQGVVSPEQAAASAVERLGPQAGALQELVSALERLWSRAGPRRSGSSPHVLPASEAAAVLACPRYFVLSAGRRPAAGGSTPSGGSALHRMLAGFVAGLRTGPAGWQHHSWPVPLTDEESWVSCALHAAFEPWRRSEGSGRSVPELTRLRRQLEQGVRFLHRLMAAPDGPRPSARRQGRGLWRWGRRRLPAPVQWQAEVPLEREIPVEGRPGLRVVGAADLLVRFADGHRVLVEFKTYPPPAHPVDLFQACLYAWMLGPQGRPQQVGPQATPAAREGFCDVVLVYLLEDRFEQRPFPAGQLEAELRSRLEPALVELARWARWQPGQPPPPPTSLPGLCEVCRYHPPCPERFPEEGGATQEAEPAAAASAAAPVPPAALEEALQQLGCPARCADVLFGPSFARYLVQPSGTTTVERIRSRAEDLMVRLGLPGEPLVESLPHAIAIDVPRHDPETVPLSAMLEHPEAPRNAPGLWTPLGVGIGGRPFYLNLADPVTPHLLVAGATGSGKSQLLLAMACGLAAWYPPERLRLHLVDPKRVTFAPLAGSPYLAGPPVLEAEQVAGALEQLVEEMEARYRWLEERRLSSMEEAEPTLPGTPARIVCMVDEFATFMTGTRKERERFEQAVRNLSARGRAAGIHLVLATQRPDSTVVSGTIKANFSARVALKTADRISSQVVLGEPGAQALAGRGDLLFTAGAGRPLRLQAPYVSPEEARRLLGATT